jgi:hypothetical protein
MGILKCRGGPRQTQCNSPDGRRGTEEDIQLAVENVHKQEFRLSQMNDCGTVIFDDDRPTVHLDTRGMQWNAELDEQEQQLHHLSSEEIQQTCSRTIELASASAGTGAAPGAGEAAAPGAREAASAGAGEAASAGSRSRGRSSSMSRFVQVDGQRHRRWKLKNAPIAPPIQLESSSRTSPERAAEAVTMPLTATATSLGYGNGRTVAVSPCRSCTSWRYPTSTHPTSPDVHPGASTRGVASDRC